MFFSSENLCVSGSLSIFHSYLYGKNPVSSSTEACFNHTVITAGRLVRVGLKNEPMHGGGERANGYAASHSPPKWERRLAM